MTNTDRPSLRVEMLLMSPQHLDDLIADVTEKIASVDRRNEAERYMKTDEIFVCLEGLRIGVEALAALWDDAKERYGR